MIDNVVNIGSGNMNTAGVEVPHGSDAGSTFAVTGSQNALSGKNQVTNLLDTTIDDMKKDDKKIFSADDVKKMTDKLNDNMNDMNLQLKFIWYKELDRLGVKMVDINTQKTIKSFPPEDVMKTLMKTKEWVGKFLDENA
ncbi:flagellar protein FlaG [Pectinatus haikarae]|uniref:flagellar protein FlaG n=1 Tax=Pectinatus haikarae TaxID=349096 RepID=UPI0018C6A834|nr:flagellar protein FlaG [Pectinatus haikarae]